MTVFLWEWSPSLIRFPHISSYDSALTEIVPLFASNECGHELNHVLLLLYSAVIDLYTPTKLPVTTPWPGEPEVEHL
jgi:hypothetical protein